jgi:hypothetical protein
MPFGFGPSMTLRQLLQQDLAHAFAHADARDPVRDRALADALAFPLPGGSQVHDGHEGGVLAGGSSAGDRCGRPSGRSRARRRARSSAVSPCDPLGLLSEALFRPRPTAPGGGRGWASTCPRRDDLGTPLP